MFIHGCLKVYIARVPNQVFTTWKRYTNITSHVDLEPYKKTVAVTFTNFRVESNTFIVADAKIDDHRDSLMLEQYMHAVPNSRLVAGFKIHEGVNYEFTLRITNTDLSPFNVGDYVQRDHITNIPMWDLINLLSSSFPETDTKTVDNLYKSTPPWSLFVDGDERLHIIPVPSGAVKPIKQSTFVEYIRVHQTAGNNMNDIDTHSKGIDLTLLTAQELKTRYQNLQKQRCDFMKQIADVDQQLEQIRAVAQRITSA